MGPVSVSFRGPVLIVGHRGTGKTLLLGRISRYLPGAAALDLDALVEEGAGKTIEQIFEEEGEKGFRKRERETLESLLDSPPAEDFFLALGAGFQGPLPQGIPVLFVRRPTDPEGRIFLDRPRLDPGLDPLEEYKKRYAEREPRFRSAAWEILTLREGGFDPDPAEEAFFRGSFPRLGGALTLLPENLRSPERWEHWIRRRLAWGIDFFEVRDDLLGPREIERALASIPGERVLYSFRRPGARRPNLPREASTDWALELGPCPQKTPAFLSLHERKKGEPLEDTLARLEGAGKKLPGTRLKAALPVRGFREILSGHRWALEDPENRTFLPSSPSGRWKWYRLLAKGIFPLQFFREGEGSAPDQPFLLEWASAPPQPAAFAAILGDPAGHSFTPAHQCAFFRQRGNPVLAVDVSLQEWREGAMAALEKLGLRYAAVTSPLKKEAFALLDKKTGPVEELGSANTIFRDPDSGTWWGTNTDLPGLLSFLEKEGGSLPGGPTVVWGGGGTLPILEKAFPSAAFHAARTGLLRRGRPVPDPALLVWASPKMGVFPPPEWSPRAVFDLSYREDSPGRLYALQKGARYTSGLGMYFEQAALQRAWWEERERGG